jgi:alpha-1,3-glucosyltransferase
MKYNTVALGFSIWSFHFMAQPEFFQCIYGAVMFCLALNFKQMTLYYAPAVFMYLLGRCCAEPKHFVKRFALLGITVILTFGILWAPFLGYGPSHKETTMLERALHVLHRIFPFQRGLFEGKVSNLWCALSTKPVSIRERMPAEWQPILALGTTLMLIVPACYRVFRVGLDQRARIENRDWTQLLWASTSTALAFFLASFQVHEKSILLALSPASLLLWQDPIFFELFSLASTWTLWPLLQVDRLEVTYFCSMIIFGCLLWLRRQSETASYTVFSSYLGWLPPLCYFGMASLHLAQAVVTVPAQLPDLFPVLWSVAGCGMFCLAWLVTCWKLLTNEPSYKDKAKAD